MDSDDEDPISTLNLSPANPSPPPPTPPFPWSRNGVSAKVRSLANLRSRRILEIRGEVKCKRCSHRFTMEFNLEEKFREVSNFIRENHVAMKDRAPDIWMSPALSNCRLCKQRNSMRPVIPVDGKSINWLFLFLGQTLGCCTLQQLKYFLQHNNIHRTGAKDRLVYSTYLTLCRHLLPNCPF